MVDFQGICLRRQHQGMHSEEEKDKHCVPIKRKRLLARVTRDVAG